MATTPSIGETMIAGALAAKYSALGYPCEIEPGPRGLVVYAASKRHVERIAADLAGAARIRDPRATWTPGASDSDEPEATRWWAVVDLNWERF